MKIVTGRIRRLFDEALNSNIISDNMLLMALSALNNEIRYNDKLTDKKVANYTAYRNQLAKVAVDNGIGKEQITAVMRTLSPERYPSESQIIKLIAVTQGNYQYKADFIRNGDMKYRTAKELQDVKQKPVIKRNQNNVEQEQQFNEICDTISNSFHITPLTADMQAKIRQIQASNDIILQTLKWFKNDINKALSDKQFNNSYDKFSYVIGVLKKKIPEVIKKLERDKKEEQELWNDNAKAIIDGDSTLEEMIEILCDKYPNSAYYGMYDYVKEELTQAIERVKKSKEQY